MLLKLLLLTSVVSCWAEAPLNNYYTSSKAPYAAAGFRPSIPFDLPGEYYPSYEAEAEQQSSNQGITFEITKQRVDFAGQEIQRVPVSEPQNQYLPPEQIVFVNNRVGNNNRKNVGHRHNHRRRHGNGNGNGNGNGGPSDTPQSNTPQNQPPQFQPNLPPVNIPLPKPNTDERFESQQFFAKDQQRPAVEYGAPNYNIDLRYKGQQSDSQYESVDSNANKNFGFVQPALEYGAPNNIFADQQKPALEYGAPARSQDNKDDELAKQFALDALNAAVENYNRLQEKDFDRIAQGQYFVVNPDHSIQKVKFTTKKSDDETKQTDFTAELKYTKVGEINDPLYKYTAEGQLVRVLKK